MGRLRARLSSESGLGLVEVVAALALFAIASTALTDVLTSSVNAHGFATQQSLGQEAADAQIENIRALPYDSVGTVGGNPGGAVVATQAASALGVAKLDATVDTAIHYVGDGIPGGYNHLTNYKQIVVKVTRNSDSRVLSSEATYIAPPTRAPYGGINQVALGVTVTDIGDNSPVPDVPIALGTGPSAPRSDTTDSNGGVLFAGMTANPTSGPTAYYSVTPTIPTGYEEMSGDVTQAQLAPGQLSNLTLRVYQPATIYVNLTKDGGAYSGDATVTVTPPSGPPVNYTVSGGSGSIPDLIPNGQYTLSATTADGLQATSVTQSVPNDYPSDLTSTFNLDLTRPNGTLSVTATNGGTPIGGVAITVTGGPNSITLTATTDSSGVANFPTVPSGTATYTVSGSYGAASFSQSGITVHANATTNVTLGVPAGSVAVTVKAGATPIPNASLTLTGPNGFSATGTSDGSGTFTFTNVGTGGGYSVLATDGAATASQGSISVSTGSATAVNLSMPVGTLKATVTDGTNPIQGVAVTLTGPNSLSVTGTTNSSGVYTFTSVGAGTNAYTVTAKLGAATASNSNLSVTSGATTNTSLTLALGSIQVTLTSGGSGVSGSTVSLTGPNSFSKSGTTNGSGIVTFSGVGAGSGYTASAGYGPATVQQTGISVTGGSTTPVSLAIPVGSIKVTVTAGGSALAGASVTLTGSGGFSAPSGTTDSSGHYTFSNVPGGAGYSVGASFGTATASQSAIAVTSGSTTNVSLALPTGSIKATVTLGGSPLASQAVTVTNGSFTASGNTDASGNYTFNNLPATTGYTVSTTYGSTTQQTGVTVSASGTTTVPLAIQTGSLKATVKNQSGTVLPGVQVTLGSTNGITAPAGTTDSSGNYTFNNLPTGSGYTITATYGGSTVASTSQTVTNGATTTVNLTVNTGTVAVTVKNQSGATLNGVSLTLNGPNSFSATGTTAGSGTYSFTLVPAGTGYTVTATYGAGSTTSASQTVTSGGTTNVNLAINTGTVTVTVSKGGTGLSGATVTLNGANSFTTSGVTSGGAGTVSFTNVPAGSGYTATTSVGAATVTSPGQTVSSGATTNVTLTIPVGTLVVTVKDSTASCALRSNKAVTITGPNSFTAGPTNTNASGQATFTNVPAGSSQYTATVASSGGTNSNITINSGSTTNVTVSQNGTC
jgi:hypothetical protein